MGDLPVQTQKDISSKSKTLVEGFRYVRKKVLDAQSITEFFKDVLDAAVGITNIDKGLLPDGVSLLVSRISIGVANAAGDNVDLPSYENVHDSGGVPTAILNGEIEITTGSGKTLLPSTPMKKFFAVGGAAMVNGQTGAVEVELKAPKMWNPGEKLNITFRGAANGSEYAANNTFLEVILMGPETASIK